MKSAERNQTSDATGMNEPVQLCRTLQIRNKKGLHARASAKFAKLADEFQCDIRVKKDGYDVGATSIMGLMLLAASKGSSIQVCTCGEDAQEALDALETLVNNRFGEND